MVVKFLATRRFNWLDIVTVNAMIALLGNEHEVIAVSIFLFGIALSVLLERRLARRGHGV